MKKFQIGIAERPSNANEVFFLDFGILSREKLRQATILREDEQALRIDIETSGGSEAVEVLALKLRPGEIGGPVFVRDELHGRKVPLLRLPRHIADRLVQEDRDEPFLLPLGFGTECDRLF